MYLRSLGFKVIVAQLDARESVLNRRTLYLETENKIWKIEP